MIHILYTCANFNITVYSYRMTPSNTRTQHTHIHMYVVHNVQYGNNINKYIITV